MPCRSGLITCRNVSIIYGALILEDTGMKNEKKMSQKNFWDPKKFLFGKLANKLVMVPATNQRAGNSDQSASRKFQEPIRRQDQQPVRGDVQNILLFLCQWSPVRRQVMWGGREDLYSFNIL